MCSHEGKERKRERRLTFVRGNDDDGGVPARYNTLTTHASRSSLFCSSPLSFSLTQVWDHEVNVPILTFDLGEAVGDVAWSPFSSTVFAAVTNDGKVSVFDLSVDRHEPLCDQSLALGAGRKLTRVAFNTKDPIILVGDDKGVVHALKLSPNLRKLTPIPDGMTRGDVEIEKVNDLIGAVDPRAIEV